MKIGIVGNYGNNNQGDEAILEGILIQLEETYPVKRKDIIVFSNDPEQTRGKYGVQSVRLYYKQRTAPGTFFNTVAKNKSVIADLDLLFVGGGGILMDLYVHSLVIFSMYGWLARLSKTPYVIYGAGAGPIATRHGKILLKSLANAAKLVTVRDDKSKKLLQSIGVKASIHVIGDPAFQVKPPEQKMSRKSGLQIGVTAVPYYHASYWPEEDMVKYTDYIQGMARNLDQVLAENPEATVNFFATKHPHDTAVTKEITAIMAHGDRCHVYDHRMTHTEIVQLSSEQDLIIGTRLHSLILALVVNKPIIAVSYHHKVADFMDLIGGEDVMIGIGALHKQDDFFAQVYRSMKRDWPGTQERFAKIAHEMKNISPEGMELVKEVYKAD